MTPADQYAPRVHRVDSLDDPRIASYRDLKDRELARLGGLFIAEGELVVRRLLASGYPVESLLATEDKLDRLLPLVPAGVPVFAASADVARRIVGFPFHSGVMACGCRTPPVALDQAAAQWATRVTVVVLPEITSATNLGALLRISSAFGVTAVLLGERCHDPFFRRCIRVSMGEVFRLTLVRSGDVAADLGRLRDRWAVEVVAAAVDADAEPLAAASRRERLALVFGNEARGIAPEHLRLCGRKVMVPMQLGTDSLNVAVAAAVFLYHFTLPPAAEQRAPH